MLGSTPSSCSGSCPSPRPISFALLPHHRLHHAVLVPLTWMTWMILAVAREQGIIPTRPVALRAANHLNYALSAENISEVGLVSGVNDKLWLWDGHSHRRCVCGARPSGLPVRSGCLVQCRGWKAHQGAATRARQSPPAGGVALGEGHCAEVADLRLRARQLPPHTCTAHTPQAHPA